MRVRGLLLLPALAILAGSSSCPRIAEPIPSLFGGSVDLASNASGALASPAPVASPAPFVALPLPSPPPSPPPSSSPSPSPSPSPLASSRAAAEAPPLPSDTSPEPPSEPDPIEPTALDPDPTATAEDPTTDEPNDPPLLEPEPPPDRTREAFELASNAKETWIYAEPRWGSKRLGYLRAGAIVERRKRPAGWSSCPDGWYRIAPKGYVCVGSTATLNIHDPVVETSARRPDMSSLPYTYAISRAPTTPLYARLPSDSQQLRAEPDLKGHLVKTSRAALDPAYVEPPPPDPTPGVLLYDRPAPPLANTWRSPEALVIGRARPRSGFALLSTFDHDGRRFGLTTELAVVPLDRTRVVRPSSFSGVALDDDGVTLPVAFIRSKHASRFTVNAAGSIDRGDALRFREAVPLASDDDGRTPVLRRANVTYLKTKDGSWVREDQIVRVDRVRRAPAWAAAGRKWIDVSILRQSLVAYEGMKPVYVTLVSTGADGLGDPKKTHSTIQGAFLIHTKHISVTMDGDNGEEFDFRDVPFVQYFTEGFALHAAYWHDDFGTPRSHGCVNLAPIDAAWLFGWTTPELPKGWHAALTLRKGTLVYTHP